MLILKSCQNFSGSSRLGIVKIILALLVVTITAETLFCIPHINQDSLIQEIKVPGKKPKKLQSGNYTLYKNFNSFIKEYNNQVHNQQYLNDSLFEQVLLLRNDINSNIKEIKKVERSIYYVRNVNTNQDIKSKTRFIITIVLIILVYLLTVLFFILNRRIFNRHNKQSNEEIKKQHLLVDKKLDELKKQLTDKIKENQKLLNELNGQMLKELTKKINDHKERIDGIIRNISNQIEDKFK